MSRLKNDKEQYQKYLSGEMSAKEAHVFERTILHDPFEQEALEGFEASESNKVFADIEKLQKKVENKARGSLNWTRVAAVAALLIASSVALWIIISPLEFQKELAMESEETFDKGPMTKANEIEERLLAAEEVSDAIIAESEREEVALAEQPTPVAREAETSQIQVGESQDKFAAISDNEAINTLQGRTAGLAVTKVEEDDLLTGADISGAEEVEVSAESQIAAFQARDSDELREDNRAKSKKEAGAAFSRSASVLSDEINSKLVTGTITDTNGEPLPGVSIVIEGTAKGTTTDIDGNYQLSNVKGQTLIISYIGYSYQEISVGERSTIDVTLSPDVTELSEVVVTAEEIRKEKRSLGYAVSESEKEKNAEPVNGYKLFKQYIEQNLKYPEAAQLNEIEGTVTLELTISAGGSISNIDIKKSLGYGCDEEAIRLVNEGPSWTAAKKNGLNEEDKVRVKVKFKLD